MRKETKGITLIALIITIIVMLILVMVSIQVLFNTGLFDATGKAAQKWNEEQDKEANMQITIGNKTYGSVEDYIAGDDIKEETNQKYFSYTIDATTKTAKITGIKEEYKPIYTYYNGWSTSSGGLSTYIKDGTTKITDVIIPEIIKIDGVEYVVTEIADNAFGIDSYETYQDSGIYIESEFTSVKIPATVTNIGESAFERCSKLTSINIPNGVTSIESYAFYGCSALTSVEIPEGLTSIGDYAFYGCNVITSVNIPAGLTNIGIGALNGLTSIVVDENNSVYDSRENCNAIIETSTNTLILGSSNTVIPESVTKIESYAFYGCSDLTSINIPVSVTSIGYDAFHGCNGLTDVYYNGTKSGWNLISISGGNQPLTDANIHYIEAVADDPKYYSYTINTSTQTATITGIKEAYRYTKTSYYESEAYTYCICIQDGDLIITDLILPSQIEVEGVSYTVTGIGTKAFGAPGSFHDGMGAEVEWTSIVLPENLTSIGDMAFFKCGELTSIVIPNGVTAISWGTFYGCYSLTDVYYTGTSEQWNAIAIDYENAPLTNATIHYNYTMTGNT